MIKKRNLDNSLIQWIMTQTGLGPGIGELFWVAPASSATSQFRTQLQRWGVEQDYKIYTSPADAYAAMEAYRNDVMLVMPGGYDLTAELAWSKSWTHMLGLGGPCNFNLHTDPGVNIYTDSTQVVETIDCTGDKCQFQNVLIANVGNHAENLAAFNLDGIGAYFSRVMFMGAKNPLNAVVVTASSLHIDSGGDSPIFEDCVIGDNNGSKRATAEHTASLYFTGTGYAMNGLFRRCRFNVKSDNTLYAHAVRLPGNYCINKQWIWDDCHFYNYDDNNTTQLAHVFWEAIMSTHSILLHNCTMQGFDKWQHGNLGDAYFGVSMPIAATAGGIVLNPTSA